MTMAGWKAIAAGALLTVGTGFAADAQSQYQANPYNPPPYARAPYNQPYPYNPAQPYPRAQPYNPVPARPPSWSFDPYTDGTVATPNAGGGSGPRAQSV